MNTPPENDFTELRRLLRLKSHEQPPPGYFHTFSSQVISALEKPEHSRRGAVSQGEVPSWIVNLFEWLQVRPALAGAFGAFLALAVVVGIVFSEGSSSPSIAMPSLLSEMAPASHSFTPQEPVRTAFDLVDSQVAPLIAQTNDRPSLFDAMPGLNMVPVADYYR